jgi:GNAT superfamily N-acetyltransferase
MSIEEHILKKLSLEEFDAFESRIDAEYFGVASAKAVLKRACLSVERQNLLLGFLDDFDFITITNIQNDPSNNHWLGEKTKAFLADVNIQLGKSTTLTGAEFDSDALISDNLPENDRIVQLAETSFDYSRFLNDPYIPAGKARGIYGDITKNAFGKPGRFFVVSSKAGITAGFLLFSMNESNSSSTIELIATDHRHKGHGIGRSLIRSMESFVSGKGMNTIKVGTQLGNIDALRFYASYGFKILECNSIYHYWPSKP